MRLVRIVDEPGNTYPHAAIDRRTGEIPLRHHDRAELIALCRRLEWRIEEAELDARADKLLSGQHQLVKRPLTRSTTLLAPSRTKSARPSA